MKLKEKINKFAVVHYKKIRKEQMIPAEFSLSNKACHNNAVAACRAGRADKVWLVWGGGDEGVVHFINSKNGKFFDETWHDYLESHQDIRIIREIHESEFDNIVNILRDTKFLFFELFGTWNEKRKAAKDIHGVI